MDFKDKVVVITGGSSGVGKSIALQLIKEKCKVIIIGKTKEKVSDTLKELKTISEECSGYVCNINDWKKIKYLIEQIVKKYNKIDFLINNAGYSNYKNFTEQSIDEITDLINTNLLGTIYFCKFSIPYINNNGHIINIASIAGKIGFPKFSIYCASKFGIIGFSESLYYELKEKSIKVSVICPGAIDTDFYRDKSFESFPHNKRHKKMLKPEDVAKIVKKTLINEKFETIIPRNYKFKILLKEVFKPVIMWYISRLPK